MFRVMSKLAVFGLVLGLISPSSVYAQTCTPESIPAHTPSKQFAIKGDGTVTDSKTGLIWQQCSLGQTFLNNTCSGVANSYTWQQALHAANTLNQSGGFAGAGDWRLPNIKELASIIERQCSDPAINLMIFPATASDSTYWSSSSLADSSRHYLAWVMTFNLGDDAYGNKNEIYQVRLVRSGQ